MAPAIRPLLLASLTLLIALLGSRSLADAPEARAQATSCKPKSTLQRNPARIQLGETVGITLTLDPGCGDVILPRHYIFVLQPWADAAEVEALRSALDEFFSQPGLSGSLVGLVLGQTDASAATPTSLPPPLPTQVPRDLPMVLAPTWNLFNVRTVLRRFGPALPGLSLDQLLRKARDMYVDLEEEDPANLNGKRHIVIIGGAAAAVGRLSTLSFEAALARDSAIDVDWYCLGGGCQAVEGIRPHEPTSVAQVQRSLEALRDRPAPLEIEYARVFAEFPSWTDYVFASANPEPAQMGRLLQNYIRWDPVHLDQPVDFRYTLRPLDSGEPLWLGGPVRLEGVTSTGRWILDYPEASLSVAVDAEAPLPSDCRLRARSHADPNPVDLGGSVDLSLDILADCPAARRPIDVVLSIDRSASMARGERLKDAREAARSFVEAADMDLARIAVVAIGSQAETLIDLSSDRPAILAAIDGLTPAGENDYRGGFDRAREILRQRRPDALPVVVTLSDGDSAFPLPGDDDPWLQAALWVHLEGIRSVLVCLTGARTCNPRFQDFAAPRSYFRQSGGGEDLQAFYGELARYLGEADLERLSISAWPNDSFAYDGLPADHEAPRVEVDGRLVWQQADPLFGRSQIELPLWARAIGTWPALGRIEATWQDREGRLGQASLAPPDVTVLPPPDSGPCQLTSARSFAEPARLALGERLLSTARMALRCEPSPAPLEIVLVLDHSLSMRGARIDDLRKAVQLLLEGQKAEHARFGLVAFSDQILAEEALTEDRARILNRLAGVDPQGDTNIGQALNRARLIMNAARPDARRYVLLVTDGHNSVGSDSVVSAADAIRDLSELMAVCVGGNCDPVLETIVSRSAYYFDVPDGPKLLKLFGRLAEAVVGLTPAELYFSDQSPNSLAVVPGTERPAPRFGPDPQYWIFGFPPPEGITVTQQLRASRPGRVPLALWQRLEYRTMAGVEGAAWLPPVAVEVSGGEPSSLPTALPWPSASPSPSTSPTPGPTATITPPTTNTPEPPSSLYLPWLTQASAADGVHPAILGVDALGQRMSGGLGRHGARQGLAERRAIAAGAQDGP
jgi:Mg-chelatase subunit ChlD